MAEHPDAQRHTLDRKRLEFVACSELSDAELKALGAKGIRQIIAALFDSRSALRYIRKSYGDLYGVGFDRCEARATEALKGFE
jgi:hypothetical protein